MSDQPIAIILAAGKGTRMKSRRPKVLHELCGRPMLDFVLDAVREAGAADCMVVVSPELREHVAGRARTVVQESQNGTGHAVRLALEALGDPDASLLVACGDMPLVPASLYSGVVRRQIQTRAAVALVTARVTLPSDFGRVTRIAGKVHRIVEHADASVEERRIDEVNAGIYCFDGASLRRSLQALSPDNAQGELYLTDCIGSLVAEEERIETVDAADPTDIMGVNTRVELAAARRIIQDRILRRHMLDGVTILDPATTYVDAAVSIGPDSTIYPQTHVRGTTVIGSGCVIGPNTTLSDARVGDAAQIVYSVARDCSIGKRVTVGPFAHLRGGSVVEEGAHIGNFVELKNTRMGRGVKAGHLSYLGDADLGEQANIGAGTITCNFDGTRKHKTKVGKRAFIGSNSSLVAPLEIGDDALTGAGSVVIRDVGEGERVAGNPAKPLPKRNVEFERSSMERPERSSGNEPAERSSATDETT